ncbi:MAG: DNA methyltransferase [Candidatus Gracilibacteria bacterium]
MQQITIASFGIQKVKDTYQRGVMIPLAKPVMRDRRIWSKELASWLPPVTNGKLIYDQFTEKKADDVWVIGQSSTTKLSKQGIYGLSNPKTGRALKRVVSASTNEGDIVMDFFSGSGSTIATAEKLRVANGLHDLGKLSFYTMQKRIYRFKIQRICKILKEYGKKQRVLLQHSLACMIQKGSGSRMAKVSRVCIELVGSRYQENKIAGYEIDGKKGGFPIKIFDYRKFKDSAINEDYLKEMHAVVGKKASGRVYHRTCKLYGFSLDYHEIDGMQNTISSKSRITSSKEPHKTPLQNCANHKARKCERLGRSHWIPLHSPSRSKVGIEKERKDEVKISSRALPAMNSNQTKHKRKGMKNFETLSAVFVDKSYNGKAFEIDEAFFADELLPKDEEKRKQGGRHKSRTKKDGKERAGDHIQKIRAWQAGYGHLYRYLRQGLYGDIHDITNYGYARY